MKPREILREVQYKSYSDGYLSETSEEELIDMFREWITRKRKDGHEREDLIYNDALIDLLEDL